MRLGTTILLATTLALGLTAPASAHDGSVRGCRNDMVTEQGTCARPVPSRPLTRAELQQLKRDADEQRRVTQGLGRSHRSAPLTIPGLPPLPSSYVIPEVEKMRLFKEGEGNGKKHYTCGPSATRNLIAALYKRRTGQYKDFGEAYFERIQGTTRAGTARKNIADSLNTKFKKFGPWTTTRPANANAYLARVMMRTKRSGQAVIANLDTEYLKRYRNHHLAHFNLVFGYDTRGTKRLRIAEEWDPIYIYGSSSYGNPYGKFWETLPRAFTSINAASIHGIVS